MNPQTKYQFKEKGTKKEIFYKIRSYKIDIITKSLDPCDIYKFINEFWHEPILDAHSKLTQNVNEIV